MTLMVRRQLELVAKQPGTDIDAMLNAPGK